MTARNVADTVGHAQKGEAESEGNADDADFVSGDYRRAAAEQDQGESADKFGEVFLHRYPPFPCPIRMGVLEF